jgi:CheY-like chemotaxis protein
MSPLRSPAHERTPEESSDYFGSSALDSVMSNTAGPSSQQKLGSTAASSSSSSSSGQQQQASHQQEIAFPNSPGSVVSLEGGEGAVLKTAIRNTSLLHEVVNTTRKKRLQILTVEDNYINRKVLAAFLDKLNADYVEATNGEEGVKVFESYPPNHFDIIFMDLSMPILDGIGATIQIRKIEAERFRKDKNAHHPAWMQATKTTALMLGTPGGTRPSAQARAKIFTLTGRSSDEDKRRAFQTGADAYLVKPLGFKVLSKLLDKVSAL